MHPCLAQICSLESSFEEDLDGYAAGGSQAVEIWLTKLEDFIAEQGIDKVKQLREKHALSFPAASMQYGLLDSEGARRDEAWQLFLRRVALCQELEMGILILAIDIASPLSLQLFERVKASLAQIANEAERHRIRIALEFQAGSSFGNNVQSAAALVEEVGSPALGLCLDVFHFHVGPSKLDDLALLDANILFHVQVSDLADTFRELATDSDRILPGEGEIALPSILHHLRKIEYTGHLSLEVMNPRIWKVPAAQFGEIGMAALKNLLAQA